MNRFVILFLLVLSSSLNLLSQVEPCYTDQVVNQMMQQDAQYAREVNQLRNNPVWQNQLQTRAVRTVSVVVHVVYNSSDENVPLTSIDNMITILNEDYRRQNANASDTRPQFVSVAADAEIQFCLDQVVRTSYSYSCFDASTQANAMKSVSQSIDPSHFLNIWIVDLCGSQFGGVGGYAYLPTFGMHGSSVDGLVIDYELGLGTTNRTATHEIGHYFGLEHTFAGCGSHANNCTDIPEQSQPNYPTFNDCAPTNTSCSSLDQSDNFMDYTTCPNMFTICQAGIMNSVLSNQRVQLLSSTGCSSGATGPTADFDSDETFGCPGLQVTFADQSSGSPTSWSWTFPGGNPASSTAQNPTVNYNTPGTYNVTLLTSNTTGNDSETKTDYITIRGASTLPLLEGFESSTFVPAGWSLNNPDGNTAWVRTSSAGGYGQSSGSVAFDNWNDDYRGQLDYLISPIYDFTAISSARLKFDYAHARYNGNNVDSLLIAYSLDCGETFTTLWRNGGSGLATASDHTGFFIPTSSEWGKDSIDISNLAGQSSVQIAFINLSGYGNNIFLDNINLFAVSSNPSPVANFSGSPLTILAGATVDFTDLSINSPTGWTWSFPGSVQGNSTQQNPSGIQYNTAGTFDVTLSVMNTTGSDSKTETGYITVIDTSSTTSNCDTTTNVTVGSNYLNSTAQAGGYVAGHNGYGDIAKADKYTGFSAGETVEGAFLGFAVAKFSGPASKVEVKVWDADGAGGTPGTVLASEDVLISQIAPDVVNSFYTHVSFSSPPTINGDFYLGIQFTYAAGDTVALFISDDGSVTPTTAWELWSDNTWHSFNDGTTSSWELDVAHDIFAIVCSGNAGPPPVAAFNSNISVVCQGENITFMDQSTGSPNSWSWSFPGGTPSTSTLQNPTIAYNTSGTYNAVLQVSNNNGINTYTSNNHVTVNSSPAGNLNVTHVSCNGGNDGSISLTVTGGATPYTYSWSNTASTQNLTGLSAGTYTVTITDANSCSATSARALNQPTALSLSATSTNADCGAANGTASAVATGGSGAYTYSWSNSGNTPTISGLTAGVYTITVADVSSCQIVAQVTINSIGVVQQIPVTAGWSMISSYVNPDNPDMLTVISNIANDIVLVKDGSGQTAIPSLSVNSIGNWDVTKGYKIKASSPVTLSIGCQQVNPLTTPVSVTAGWSIISYLRTSPMNIAGALSSINSELLIAKDGNGNVYLPSIAVNNIGNMVPGQGYKVKLSTTGTLTYPANAKHSDQMDFRKQQLPEHFVFSQNTGSNATIVLPYDGINGQLSEGDEIGVFSKEGNLVGGTVFEGSVLAITVWGDDQATEDQIEGMSQGQDFVFKVWRKDDNKEFDAKVEFAEGDEFYVNDGVSFLKKLEVAEELADIQMQFECYPNPNEGEFEIKLAFGEKTSFTVDVLNIFGQAVYSTNSEQISGNSFMVVVKDKPAGTYFVRVKTTEASFIKKVLKSN